MGQTSFNQNTAEVPSGAVIIGRLVISAYNTFHLPTNKKSGKCYLRSCFSFSIVFLSVLSLSSILAFSISSLSALLNFFSVLCTIQNRHNTPQQSWENKREFFYRDGNESNINFQLWYSNLNSLKTWSYFFLTLTGTARAGFCLSDMLRPVLTPPDIPN